MDEADVVLRNVTYRLFAVLGRAPTMNDVAAVTGSSAGEVRAGWERLHRAHALVLHPATPEIRMANPFSAGPTACRVQVSNRWWYANCGWDAFGICAAFDANGRIESSCPDCGDLLEIEVQDRQPSDESLLFHSLVPASRWWDDIVFS
jgi:hypothetical protein